MASNHQPQPQMNAQQLAMQSTRMMAVRNGAPPNHFMSPTQLYGAPPRQQQVLMQQQPANMPMGTMAGQPPPSQQQQPQYSPAPPRFIIARPQQQTPPNSQQQMHSSPPNIMMRNDGGGPQMYQQTLNQQQMNRNQGRAMQSTPQPQQQYQMMQQPQGTPPNQQQQQFANTSPYTPPQNPLTPQSQYSNPQQHSIDQQRQQYMQQQPSTPHGQQQPLTPQQQHSQSPGQRKNTAPMMRGNSMQDDGSMPSGSQDQPHYVVHTSTPSTMYNVPSSSTGQPQIMYQVSDSQQQDNSAFNNPVVVSQQNIPMRHHVTQRPVRFANQPGPQIVRYAYPGHQQQPQSIIVQQPMNQPQRIAIRQGAPNRPQFVQVVQSDGDAGARRVYQVPVSNNAQGYVVPSQPNIYYRPSTPQQHQNPAIRQALGHEGTYHQQQMMSQSPMVIQSVDNQGGPVLYRVPAMQRQTSTEASDSSGNYPHSVPPVVESTVAEFAAEQHQMAMDTSDSSGTPKAETPQPEQSPSKKPKTTPKSGANKNGAATGKPSKSKPKKAPNKAMPSGATAATTSASDAIPISAYHAIVEGFANAPPAPLKPLITKEMIDSAAKSVNQSLVIEDDVKAGIMLYMQNYVERMIKETGRAATLRKSKRVQTKDVDYALKTKFNIHSLDSPSKSGK